MTTVFRFLREDHDYFRILLDAIDREIQKFLDGDEVDYELLGSGSDFLHAYAQNGHHPLEERLVAKTVGVTLPQQTVEELEHQHRRLERALHDLRSAFSAILDGQTFERQPLANAGLAMATEPREHMQWEETVLFPMLTDRAANIEIGELDWGESNPESALRPLESRFEALLRRLRGTPD